MKLKRRKPLSSRILQIECLEQRTVLTAPTFTSPAAISVAENLTAVETVTATDPDTPAQTLTFSISGGADAALFSINPTTGALAFLSAQNFEAPADAGADHVYNVAITVDDGNQGTATQNLAVTLTGLNDNAPVFTSPATYNVNENTQSVGTVTATDADLPAQTITYSITGGADQSRFSINATTGALTFVTAPNFEVPVDVGANNVYNVDVTANDGSGSTTVKSIAVTVLAVEDAAPVITSQAAFTITENNTVVGTVVATDADLPADTITYSITGGADAALFAINPSTGALSFLTGPNFEAPTDTGANNIYNLTVTANDGTGSTATQNITVTVVNLPVVFSSPTTFSVPENTTAVGTVVGTDVDVPPQSLTYSITGGADMALFSINANTGELTFLAAPNFEVPTDAGGDHVYNIQVTANTGSGSAGVQSIAVTVTAVNDNAPVFTSSPTFNVQENTTTVGTVVTTDADLPAQSRTYSITGGADSALFSINATTGVLTFLAAPNFEAPLDAGANNVYNVDVTANDGSGLTTTQSIAVTVQNVLPVFTSPTAFNVNENSTAVGTVVVTDSDAAGGVTYSITGGADMAKFSINPTTGVLTFLAAPDFETPSDVGANNVYDLQVTASDGTPSTATQNIAVSVVNLAPTFTSSANFTVAENTTAAGTVAATDSDVPAQAVTYSITGGADSARFAINATTGALTFVAAPNFEAPADAGTNNVYNVQVTASAGAGSSAVQNVTVTVTSANDNAPVFTSPATFNVPENTATAGTVVATDADLPAQTLAYSITGGADSALFSINPTTGVLAFLAAPNFEVPLDVGVDNIYNVEVTAADGLGMTTIQSVAVTVTPLNDNAPVFTSVANFTVAENSTAVGNMTATDSDLPPQTLTYSISGGADAALFAVDPITGVLTFKVAPDFETPHDAGANNVYNVTVKADDNGGSSTTKDLLITVTNESESPVITVNPQTATYYLHKDRAFVSPTATFVADSTTTNFTDSKLVVSITSNRHFRDVLSIYPKGNRSGQINVEGHRVLYSGHVIGRVHGGRGPQSELTVKFNSSATTAAINQLVKRINFNADSRGSIGSTRTVQFQLISPDGTVTSQASRMINVLAPV